MKSVTRLLIALFLVIAISNPLFAAEKESSGLNLRVGENFYFEGNVKDAAANSDDKEASMEEIQTVPFYKTTWFITTVSIIAVAGASTAVYFLAQEEDRDGNVVEW